MDTSHNRRWTVELHQTDSGSWVGVVKQRGGEHTLDYMSEYHPTAMFAFTDCLDWIKTAEGLEKECLRLQHEPVRAPAVAGRLALAG